jgi:hypothetical protein
MSMFCARFAVFVRRARVLPTPCPATRNLSFLRCHRRRYPVVSTRCFTGDGTGWCENSTRWKSCKWARTRGGGAWVCLAHGLQCLCDGRACCPPRALQLVICVFWRFHRRLTLLFQLGCFTGMVRVGVKIPQDGNRTNVYGHVAMINYTVTQGMCGTWSKVYT